MTDYYSEIQADNFRLCRSRLFQAPADDIYNVIRVPRKSYVTDVGILISTAYAEAGATITVGYIGNSDTADPDYFLLSATIDPDALGWTVAVKPMYFDDAGGSITVTVDDDGGAAGTFMIFAKHTLIY